MLVAGERPRLLAVDELPEGLELVLLGVDGDGRAVFAADPGDELAGERRGPARPGAGALAGRGRDGRPRGRAAQLAPPPPLLRELRRAERGAGGRARARVPGVRRAAPSAHRPGGDHARHRRRSRAARPPGARGPPGATARSRASSSRARASRRPWRARCARRPACGWPTCATAPRSRGRSRPRSCSASRRAGRAASPPSRDDELEDVGWFTREAIVGGDVLLPPPTAIARRLIDEWLGDDEAPDAAGGLAVSRRARSSRRRGRPPWPSARPR